MRFPKRSLSSYAPVLLLLAGLVPTAGAQVTDQAGFFSPDAVRQANQLIADIQRQTGRKVVVETFRTAPVEAGSNAPRGDFYESWIQDRGKATGSDIEVLVVREPSHLEVGSSSEMRKHDFTPNDHHAVSAAMLNGFKAKQFDRALLDGLNDISARVRRNQSGGGGAAAAAGSGAGTATGGARTPDSSGTPAGGGAGYPAGQRAPSGGVCGMGGIGGLLCLGVVVLVGFSILRGIMRRRTMGGGFGQPGMGMGQPGIGQPGYGQPGYGGGGGGGGFGRGMLGGLLGGVLGGAAYDHFRGGSSAHGSTTDPNTGAAGGMAPSDDVSSGGDFGSDASGFSSGGDFGGGGDSGGGDVSSGGDF